MYGAAFSFMLITTWKALKDNPNIRIDNYKYIQRRDGDQESPPNEWSLL